MATSSRPNETILAEKTMMVMAAATVVQLDSGKPIANLHYYARAIAAGTEETLRPARLSKA